MKKGVVIFLFSLVLSFFSCTSNSYAGPFSKEEWYSATDYSYFKITPWDLLSRVLDSSEVPSDDAKWVLTQLDKIMSDSNYAVSYWSDARFREILKLAERTYKLQPKDLERCYVDESEIEAGGGGESLLNMQINYVLLAQARQLSKVAHDRSPSPF